MKKQKQTTMYIGLRRTMCLFVGLAICAIMLLAVTYPAQAATSSTINFQARLLSAAGNVVPDGYYNVEFKLYNASTVDGGETPIQGACTANPGGVADEDCVWVETRISGDKVRVANGYLTVNLGSVTAFSGSIDWSQEHWLTMNIGGTGTASWDGEMNPRLKLTATPYAFDAGRLGGRTAAQFLQLQSATPGSAQTGHFNISGTGIAGSLQAGSLDAASATSLGVGLTNATSVSIGKAAGSVSLQGGVSLATALGAATSNGASICRDSSTTVLIACDANTTGRPFLQGGNTFGATAALGTNDSNSLQVKTNNVVRLTIDTSNAAYFGNGVTASTPSSFTIAGTGSSSTSNAGAGLTLQGGAGYGSSTGSAGGTITVAGGSAGGSGNNAAGSVLLQGGTATGTGAAGRVIVRNTTNSTQALDVENASSENVFTVDTSNSRVGIAMGSTTVPSLSNAGLQIQGALRLSGSGSGVQDSFTTPNGSTVTTRFSIQTSDPGSFNQLIAIGLNSTAQSTSRGISVFDARTGSHQQSIGVFSPNENDIFGLSWDGSNTVAKLKTLDQGGNSSGTSIDIQSGSGAGTGAGGSVKLQGGNGGGTDGAGGNITLAAGTKSGAGVAGKVIVRNGTDSLTTFQVQNAAGSTTIFNVDSTNARVGIGNAAPAYKLDVSGDIYSNSVIRSNAFDRATAGTMTLGASYASAIELGSASNGLTSLFMNTFAGTDSNFYMQSGSVLSSSNIQFAMSKKANNTDLWMYAHDGSTSWNYLQAEWTTKTIRIGDGSVAGTVQIGNTGGAVAQTINIGTNSTASSTNTVAIGSGSTNSTTTINGGTSSNNNITFQTNQASSGVIAKSATNSTGAFQVQNSSSVSILGVDTINSNVSIGSSSQSANMNVSGDIALGTSLEATQGFEGVTFVPTSPGTWSTGGNGNWTRTTSQSYAGSASAVAADVGNSQVSWLDLNYTFAVSGVLSFNWKVSSEDGYDFLNVCLDNDTNCNSGTSYYTRISGETGWGQVAIPVGAGAHSFRWSYTKDSSSTSGSDIGWIDNVRFTASAGGSIAGTTLQLAGASGINLSSGSGNITIGSSDTVGTLLVLDTKTSSGDPSGVNGGMYYNSSVGRMRCYEDSEWKNCVSTPLLHRYYQSGTAQSIPNGTETRLKFNTAETNDGKVTPGTISNTYDTFTVNKTGIWRISVNVRLAGVGTNERALYVLDSANPSTTRYCQQNLSHSVATAAALSCSSDVRLTSGTVIAAMVYQASGGSLSVETSWTGTNISLTWIGD